MKSETLKLSKPNQGNTSDQFKAIDENGDGGVSFDEWLGFAYKNYQSQKLPAAFDKSEKDAFVADCKEVITYNNSWKSDTINLYFRDL